MIKLRYYLGYTGFVYITEEVVTGIPQIGVSKT